MIRTPEPRKQADVLVATLAALGITLGRRQSLEVIAKLSGYKGWNEYAADLKKPVAQLSTQPATFALPSEPLLAEASKQVPLSREKPLMQGIQDDGWVSAYPFSLSQIGAEEGYGISVFRLAQHYQHAKSDSFTEIAQAVVDTKVYTLVCRGKVHVTHQKCEDVPEDGLAVFDSAKGISEEALELLENDEALSKMTINEKPEFVWLNELGMPIREGTDIISTDPKMELRILALDLHAQRRRQSQKV